MIRTIEVEENDDFETCDNCIHSDDTEVICKIRGCTHAILDSDIKECYQSKAAPLDKAKRLIQKLRGCSCNCSDGIIDDVEDILGKLIESEDK